jgi:serine phosphatase RsbU (regulator of sigma subunit)
MAHRERDLQLTGYVNQAARAVRAVCTRRKELELAGRMQASLLPEKPPSIDGWQLAPSLWPARETSGDFYDLIPLPNGKLGIVIADVADKGMGAALYMALSRTLIRTYATDYPERPDLALNAANARILADTQADLFVTVFYGILDPATGALTYCNAGHHPPYLLDPKAPDPVRAVPGRGLALGVIEDTKWTHSTLRIPPGTLLLMYTDGVVDALDPFGERFGAEQMLDIAQENLGCSANDLRDDLLTRLQQFIGDEPQFDDITLMALEREAR